jgi:hypothetical protein
MGLFLEIRYAREILEVSMWPPEDHVMTNRRVPRKHASLPTLNTSACR